MHYELNRKECSALRGLAILAIVLHNYCHWLRFAVKENEYTFSESNNFRLWQVICNPDENLFVHLMSYFGHYGVPIFLFLSGYGLVKKYEREGEKEHGVYTFMRYHYLKLFKMMITGFVAFIIVDIMTIHSFHFHWYNVIAQMLMYINLLDHPNSIIWPGPYWFFGLMIEAYLVYRLLIYRRHWGVVVGLIAICWLAQVFCDPEGETLNRLRYNIIGGMLPFGVGVLFARFSKGDSEKSLRETQNTLSENSKSLGGFYLFLMSLVAAAITFVMSFNYQLWFFEPVMVIVTLVLLVKALPQVVNERLIWVGGISAAMFVAHPTMRKIFIPISHRGDVYDGLLLYIIATIAVSWMFKLIIDKIPNPHIK